MQVITDLMCLTNDGSKLSIKWGVLEKTLDCFFFTSKLIRNKR